MNAPLRSKHYFKSLQTVERNSLHKVIDVQLISIFDKHQKNSGKKILNKFKHFHRPEFLSKSPHSNRESRF